MWEHSSSEEELSPLWNKCGIINAQGNVITFGIVSLVLSKADTRGSNFVLEGQVRNPCSFAV